MTTTITAARAAADWWADAVGAPTFDNGDRSAGSGLVAVMAHMVAAQSPVDTTSATRFRDLLEQRIQTGLDRGGYGVTLGVDYGPDRDLGDAAQAAGVSSSRFPWKTNMWVHTDHVTVSAGYGAGQRLIWSAPDWQRPTCGTPEYDANGVRQPRDCGLPKYHDSDHDFTVPVSICGARVDRHANHMEQCRRGRDNYVHTGSTETWYADRAHNFVDLADAPVGP